MKNTRFKAGLCVPKRKIGNVAFNKDEIIQTRKENKDCQILLFPELSLTGYTCGDLFFQAEILESCISALEDIKEASKENKGARIILGLPLRKGNSLYNVAAFLNNGKILGFVPKSYLPNYSEFYEQRWFKEGKGIEKDSIFLQNEEIPFGTDLLFYDDELVIGGEICEDLFVPDKPSTHLALKGANVIVNLSASDEVIGKHDYRKQLVLGQSGSCYLQYLYVSSGEDESSTDLVFSGNRLVGDNGSLVLDEIYPKPGSVKKVILDYAKSIHNRVHQTSFGEETSSCRYIPCSLSRLGGEKNIIVSALRDTLKQENYLVNPFPFIPGDKEREERAKTILSIQAHGLATRVKKTGLKNLIVGVSGGLDSTLALLVRNETKKLVPDVNLIGYTRPNRGNTSSLTYQNSRNLRKEIGCEIHEVDIHDGVESHLLDIGHPLTYLGEKDTAYENAQARRRTYILRDVANRKGGIVVGTGDLSELALGWCTYNGDHRSRYGVNASIPKTLVKYLVRSYASYCQNKALSKTLLSILDTPITPELTPNKDGKISQRTEEKVGKYDLNDFFLFYLLRYGYSPDKILLLASLAYPTLSLEELKESEKRFYSRFYSQAFKRSCLPDGPKVGTLSLSPRGDYRRPSDANVEDRLKTIDNIQ